eukprot:TRINITY_DN21256_c0_g2_i1.p1 TRINITY_DN21256_c0_g2~~TRINITY_DN21256_c0_g2_i1.p1  ORF type:complete len:121 (-),score=23.83 TRINITY_DN21256_c0_g2_i1:163-525(-)
MFSNLLDSSGEEKYDLEVLFMSRPQPQVLLREKFLPDAGEEWNAIVPTTPRRPARIAHFKATHVRSARNEVQQVNHNEELLQASDNIVGYLSYGDANQDEVDLQPRTNAAEAYSRPDVGK